MTLKDYLDGLTTNPLLKGILSVHTMLHGSPPSMASVTYHAQVTGSFYQSVHSIKGGGKSLVDSFLSVLKGLGVDFFCGSGVSRILTSQDGSITGVTLDSGDYIACENCIFSIHPSYLPDLVEERFFRPAFLRRVRAYEDTPSAFMIFARSDRPIPEVENSNIYLCPSPDLERWLHNGAGERELPHYISCSRNIDGTGGQGVVLMRMERSDRQAFSRTSEYRARKKESAERMLAFVEEKVPSLAGALIPVESATPLTFMRYGNSPRGSLYGSCIRSVNSTPCQGPRSGAYISPDRP
jgi:all-trans-retinol 13,14-reductase